MPARHSRCRRKPLHARYGTTPGSQPCPLRHLTLASDGALSGEERSGLAKRDFMVQAFSPATLTTMRAIKAALDPGGILDAGKVLPPA
nr:FAD-linked oxidase C-terminal domain-containing protein [Stenotrophomonas maltophilia]